MRLFNGFALGSPLHARALPNLQERALKAMRSVALDSGTLWTAYRRAHRRGAHDPHESHDRDHNCHVHKRQSTQCHQ